MNYLIGTKTDKGFLKDFSDQIRQNHVFNGNVGKTLMHPLALT